ncbi:AAA family ATPase [Undibacterium sp.]|uniref:AAA family ATPase n=1 Tax=Undibacterium sp. TaxID=1914977 RepID=UPI00272FBE6C|nr:ATP-binding protein [Undibacterium sp.]MDP1980506.1 ATP-binding protein [Undibacterium sp.]
MNKQSNLSKARPMGGIAAIATLDVVQATLEQLATRRQGVPGIGVLYGPSGWGKTFATNSLANESRAYYVQMLSAWRSKDLLSKILSEMNVAHKGGTASKLLDMVTEQLSASRRTLIIDEFDHAAKSDTLIELTRDIYEGSQGSLLLVGEEMLPRKLEAWERFHSRVSAWAPAQRVSYDDAEKLTPIYCPDVELTEDVLDKLVTLSKGSVRRVVTCLTAIHQHSQLYALDQIGIAELASISLPADRAPDRRV